MFFLYALMFLSLVSRAYGAVDVDNTVVQDLAEKMEQALAVLEDEDPEVVSVILRHWADHCEYGAIPAFCVSGEMMGYVQQQSSDRVRAGKRLSTYLPAVMQASDLSVECIVKKINDFKGKLPTLDANKSLVEFIKGWVAKIVANEDKKKAIKDMRGDLLKAVVNDELAGEREKVLVMFAEGMKKSRTRRSRLAVSKFANVFAGKDSFPWTLLLWKCVLIPSLQFVSKNGYQEGCIAPILEQAATDALKLLKSFDSLLKEGDQSALSRTEVVGALKESKFVKELRQALSAFRCPAIGKSIIRGDDHTGMSVRQDQLQIYLLREHAFYSCCADLAAGEDLKVVVERMLSAIAQYIGCGEDEGSLRNHACTCRDLGWPLVHFEKQVSDLKLFLDKSSEYPLLQKIQSSESFLNKKARGDTRLKYLWLEQIIEVIADMLCAGHDITVKDIRDQMEQGSLLYLKAEYERVMPCLSGGLDMLLAGLPEKFESSLERRGRVKNDLWKITVDLLKKDAEERKKSSEGISKQSILLQNRESIYSWACELLGEQMEPVLREDWFRTLQGSAPEKHKPCVLKSKVLK